LYGHASGIVILFSYFFWSSFIRHAARTSAGVIVFDFAGGLRRAGWWFVMPFLFKVLVERDRFPVVMPELGAALTSFTAVAQRDLLPTPSWIVGRSARGGNTTPRPAAMAARPIISAPGKMVGSFIGP